MFTGNPPLLTLVITTNTLPGTKIVHILAEKNLLSLLQSDEVLQKLAQTLSEKFKAPIQLTGVRTGSIKVDMVLEDLSGLECIKEMSDKWVLSAIVDSVLMTQDFIESCQAEDVALEVVVEDKSYQQLKSHSGWYKKIIIHLLTDCKKMSVVQSNSEYLSFIIRFITALSSLNLRL